MNMNVFVTGATGFLGAPLCQVLNNAGHHVTAVGCKQCDLTDSRALEPFTNTRFQRIYHLAAWTQAGDFCLRHPAEQWVINQQINTNILTWWQRSQPQAKFVSIGTSCAYDADLELSEEHYLDGRPIDSLFTYAMTKRMLYTGLQAFRKQWGLDSLTVVPSTLYGPGYHTDGRQMHFIFDLIRKILRGKYLNEPVVLWGDGHQRREVIHVDDFVRLMQELADDCQYDLVNIGAGAEHTIREFADLICAIVDYDSARIQYDTSRYVGAKSKCLRIERLKQLVPGLQLTPLETGLRDVVGWFNDHRQQFFAPGTG
jgi:GDP-L-fucose synthase